MENTVSCRTTVQIIFFGSYYSGIYRISSTSIDIRLYLFITSSGLWVRLQNLLSVMSISTKALFSPNRPYRLQFAFLLLATSML